MALRASGSAIAVPSSEGRLHAIGCAAGVGKRAPQTRPSLCSRTRLPLRSPSAEGREAGFRGACAEPPSAWRDASRQALQALRADGSVAENLFVERRGSDS